MAKTILAISLVLGSSACSSSPRPAPTTTTEDPTTTEPPTTRPEPTTTTSAAPERAVEAPTTTRTTLARSAPTTSVYVGPVAGGDAPLACIRSYEQGVEGYATDTGNSFFGAYQFSLSTWRSVGGSGSPADASPAEQDMRAQMLYEREGLVPWPTPARMCR